MSSRVKKIISDLSASGVSRVLAVAVNSLYFILAAAWLTKTELGTYAYCLAGTQMAALILTCGTAPIMVRRVAGRAAPPEVVLGSALFQRVAFPAVFAVGFLVFSHFTGIKVEPLNLMAFAFVVAAMGQYTTAQRQALIAEQKFWWATASEQIGTGAKIGLGVALAALGYGAWGLFVALFVGLVAEFIFSSIVIKRVLHISASPRYYHKEVWTLAWEGLPLMGAILFDQGLLRFDTIFMGASRAMSETGEYAFARRIYETSWMPHATLSTILLPRLCTALRTGEITDSFRRKFTSMHRIMIAVSSILPLIMAVSWVPVIDAVTKGKYGAVNKDVIRILCIAVPFAAGTGMLWNLAMAMRKTFWVMVIIGSTSLLNVILNVVMIPRWGSEGAAIGASIPMVYQYFAYFVLLHKALIKGEVLWGFLLTMVCVFGGFAAAVYVPSYWPVQVLAGLAVFGLLLLVTGTFKKQDWATLIGPSEKPVAQEGVLTAGVQEV